MERSNEELTLDGNAVGGQLSEITGADLTGTMATCPDCGRRAELATLRVYTHAPGVVVRCPACVQLVVVRTPRGVRYEARVRVEGHFPSSG